MGEGKSKFLILLPTLHQAQEAQAATMYDFSIQQPQTASQSLPTHFLEPLHIATLYISSATQKIILPASVQVQVGSNLLNVKFSCGKISLPQILFFPFYDTANLFPMQFFYIEKCLIHYQFRNFHSVLIHSLSRQLTNGKHSFARNFKNKVIYSCQQSSFRLFSVPQ